MAVSVSGSPEFLAYLSGIETPINLGLGRLHMSVFSVPIRN